MLSHVKVNTPPVYSGAANIEALDRWAYAVNGCIEMHALDEEWAVRLVSKFLTGKASTFYMRHVAHHRKRWTMKLLYEGLFDYCFPPNYKSNLRERLMNYEQRSLFFVDFAREVESLASKFPDISKRQQVFIIWKGAAKYIRLKWIDHGMSPEDAHWSKLVRWASKFEAAEIQRKKEESTSNNR